MPYIEAFFLLIFSVLFHVTICKESYRDISTKSTDVASEIDKRLLLLSTLDGHLYAVQKDTGIVLWEIQDKPVVQVPVDTSEAIIPLFLPDPRDGSLYLLGQSKQPLKKLPFTIPQLVASSPCRSSDGILYTGKKKDSWFLLDPITGQRQHILGWDTSSPTCPIQSHETVYLGRTQYTIMMIDTQNGNKKWNVTFYDYSSISMNKDMLTNYEYLHFASSSTGRIVTIDRRTNELLWELNMNSPLASVYLLDLDGLISVPFTIMANHSLSNLAMELAEYPLSYQSQSGFMKLYPTIYIGEHLFGLYAMPSYVDQNLVSISATAWGPLLLGGPDAPDLPRPYPDYPVPGKDYQVPLDTFNDDSLLFQSVQGNNNYTIIFIGHYNVPSFTNTKLLLPGNNQLKLITHEPDDTSEKLTINEPTAHHITSSIGTQTDFDKTNITMNSSRFGNITNLLPNTYDVIKQWVNQQENKGYKLMFIILFGCMISMFWYLKMQVREFQQLSQSGSNASKSSSFHNATALSEELPNGFVKVGKITFQPDKLLGKGCEGTFVYKGEFDNREVAVKRLLPECFTFADREVALLRESDAHPNVIRYFCTEQDRMFRYIALELCEATLHDYIQGKWNKDNICKLDILQQTSSGLKHLHSLGIVHRDIKPHNVLLSAPDVKGRARAMISDFGLCKKLQMGKVSFSRRSGITGTDGWIAPEMLRGNDRTTQAVDLFSLGCVFYYVLTMGKHPFGDPLRRQANILSSEYNLNELSDLHWSAAIQKSLIRALISANPNKRPSCNDVLAHPMFWDTSKILSFLQDVSDRVEKAEANDLVLINLETNVLPVVRGDWRLHVHEDIARDLRKYRSYRGESVRDLLRALRNKKHHYRELTPEAQDVLGDIPNKFTHYWLNNFPLLLTHAWLTMQCVANEPNFAHYYTTSYRYDISDNGNFETDEDYSNYVSSTIDIFERTDKRKEYYKSPIKKYNYKSHKRRDTRNNQTTDKIQERVGLYRNLNNVNGELIREHSEGRPGKNGGNNFHTRKMRKSTEPAIWSLPSHE